MSDKGQSRREFFGASTGITAAVAAALADPPRAAAQSAGVKKADLPDLTIKEVKVYVADLSNFRRLNSSETGEIVSVVTNSGHRRELHHRQSWSDAELAGVGQTRAARKEHHRSAARHHSHYRH